MAQSEPFRAGSFQQRVGLWLDACFDAVIGRDKVQRNQRLLEEALETVQAAGCTADEAHQLVDYVFSRPVGELHQEVGGLLNTIAALCLVHDLDMEECAETELARCWDKIGHIRAKWHTKPKILPSCPTGTETFSPGLAEAG